MALTERVIEPRQTESFTQGAAINDRNINNGFTTRLTERVNFTNTLSSIFGPNRSVNPDVEEGGLIEERVFNPNPSIEFQRGETVSRENTRTSRTEEQIGVNFGWSRSTDNEKLNAVKNGVKKVEGYENYSMIQTFRKSVTESGLAMTNRFNVYFSPPPILLTPPKSESSKRMKEFERYSEFFSPENSNQLMLTCYRAELPGVSVLTSDYRNYGPSYKVPYNTQYNDLALEFYVSSEMYEKAFFDNWIYRIQNPTTFDVAFYNDYSTNIIVYQYDVTESGPEQFSAEYTYAVYMLNAYPIAVDPLAMTWEDQNVFHRLRVTFAYKRWLPADYVDETFENQLYGNTTKQIVPFNQIFFTENSSGRKYISAGGNINNNR